MSATHHKTTLWIVPIVLIAYALPIYGISLAAMLTKGFSEPNFILSWFSAFVGSADESLNQFHKVLLPLISGLSVIAFRDQEMSKWTYTVVSVLLLTILIAIGMDVVFRMENTQANLEGLRTGSDPVIDFALTKAFFTRMQETLFTYLMILLGLTAGKTFRVREEGE